MKPTEIAVSVQNLEKKFGEFIAVNRVSFDVGQGEIFGFLGPNGAGKSTTIRMLCGIYTPTSGAGTVGGYDVMKEQRKIKQHIGYMSQKFSLYDDLTVEENVHFYGGIYGLKGKEGREREEFIIKATELIDFRKRLTRTLPGGWKQRLALGCALIHKPRILFLDEPTSGVDPITRNNFWDVIKRLAEMGVTVFVTTHYMDEAERCNRITLIYRGTLIAMGTPMEMKTKFMEDSVIEIIVPDSESWSEKLVSLDSVKETALFGSAIHAVVHDPKVAVSEIKKSFDAAGIKGYKVEKIIPSLEDVFVSLIETYDKKQGEDSRKV